MGIWMNVQVEALAYTSKHVSVVKIIEELADGEDIVFERKHSEGANQSLTKHNVEFRIEIDGDRALDFLKDLRCRLSTKIGMIKFSLNVSGLLLY